MFSHHLRHHIFSLDVQHYMLPLSLIFIAAQGEPRSRADLELYGMAFLQEFVTAKVCNFMWLLPPYH